MGKVWDKLVQCQAKYKPESVYTNVDVGEGTDVLGSPQFCDRSGRKSQNLNETFLICVFFHVTKLAIVYE